MGLGSTQTLTEMCTRNWGCKGGRCVGLTTLPPYVPSVKKFWAPLPPVTLTLFAVG